LTSASDRKVMELANTPTIPVSEEFHRLKQIIERFNRMFKHN